MKELTRKDVKPEVAEAVEKLERSVEEFRLEVEMKRDELLEAIDKYRTQRKLYELVVGSLNTKCN